MERHKFKLGQPHYILDKNRNPIMEFLNVCIKFIRKSIQKIIIAQEIVNNFKVSTVFLGIDQAHIRIIFSEKKRYRPHIFETKVFDKKRNNIYCDRYSTWEEAEEGHKKAVQWVLDGCQDEKML